MDVAVARKRQVISDLILGTGFSLTGAGTIAIGVLLPVISAKWGLGYEKAGQLLFMQFLGSSLGAIFSGKDRVRSMAAGYALLVIASCALIFTERSSLFPAYFAFGLGLGLAMTSTNLLVSDRHRDDRAAKLERFNFGWSFGAMVTPLLLVPFLNGASLRLLYLIFAGLFLLLFLWVLLRERRQDARGAKSAAPAPPIFAPRTFAPVMSLVPLLVLAVCAIGVETALSEWLTTYSRLVSPLEFGGGAVATALFMFGIVSSRFAASTRLLAKIGRKRALRSALWCSAAAVALLIAGHRPLAIDVTAVLAGLSVGPQFPLLLSYLLERSPRGWIFAVAGIGSVVFPWITGLLSGHYGSLRYGLLAPCGAALLMILVSTVRLEQPKAAEIPSPA